MLFDAVFLLGVLDRLPLHVRGLVGAATLQWDDVIRDVPGASAGAASGRWAGLLPLEVAAGATVSRECR